MLIWKTSLCLCRTRARQTIMCVIRRRLLRCDRYVKTRYILQYSDDYAFGCTSRGCLLRYHDHDPRRQVRSIGYIPCSLAPSCGILNEWLVLNAHDIPVDLTPLSSSIRNRLNPPGLSPKGFRHLEAFTYWIKCWINPWFEKK